MDIRDVLQEAVNRHPQRVVLFNQIKEIRSISCTHERISKTIKMAREWFVMAMHSDDPNVWNSCMSAFYSLMAAAYEIHDKKEALHWARGEAVSQQWNDDWDHADEVWHSII